MPPERAANEHKDVANAPEAPGMLGLAVFSGVIFSIALLLVKMTQAIRQ